MKSLFSLKLIKYGVLLKACLRKDDLGPWFKAGSELEQNENWKAAIAVYSAILENKCPESLRSTAYSLRGIARGNLGLYAEGEEDLSKALQLLPEEGNAPLFAEYHYNRALLREQQQNWPKAHNDYTAALTFCPEHFQALTNRGLLRRQQEELEGALRDLKRATELLQADEKTWNELGLTYSWAGQSDEAILAFSKALRLQKDFAEAYFNRAVDLGNLGQFSQALADLNSALQYGLDDENLHFNRALCLYSLRQYSDAKAEFQEILRGDPASLEALEMAGKSCMRLNQLQEAEVYFARAVTLGRGEASICLNYAHVLILLNRGVLAQEIIEALLEEDPNFTEAREKLALLLVQSGRLDEAIDQYSLVLEAKPKAAGSLIGRAQACYHKGDYSKALHDLDQAIGLNPSDPKLIYDRALCKIAMRDLRSATADLVNLIDGWGGEIERPLKEQIVSVLESMSAS